MPTSFRRVQQWRAVALWILRSAAVWLIAWGAFQVTARLIYGVSRLDLQAAIQYDTGVGETHGVFRGGSALIVGITLAWFSRGIARWIVRPPEDACPGCGYEGGGTEGRCPECGLREEMGIDRSQDEPSD